jgi:16S rRNA processing protein RimM
MAQADRIQIGVVGKPHGVRGGFHLDGSIDAPALVAGLRLRIGEAEFTVATRGGTDQRPLLTLVEIGDRDAIAELRGQAVVAERGDLTPLGPDEWFAEDLTGLAVLDDSGSAIGKVLGMTNLPSVDVLDVELTAGGVTQLPMLHDAIRSIDVDRGVTVDAEFLDLP